MEPWHEAKGRQIQYTSVAGYFLQDDPDTNPSGFDYAQHNFGLIDRKYPTDDEFDPDGIQSQWQRFSEWVHHLNHDCGKGESTRYKVVFFGRHGQGYHNVAESYYGTPAWNCYWAELEGNGTITWADPVLTADGFSEAQKANSFYKTLHEEQSMPHFESYYSSPLKRCLQTANTTFGTLKTPPKHPFVPTIKELFREDISIHTCDRRSTKSEIAEFMPGWNFEDGFTEKDELWQADKGETPVHQVARSKAVLDDVFTHDGSTWISVTSHSGEIAALLTALNHRPFGLSTGQIIPVLIKADVVPPAPSSTTTATTTGFTPEATCEQPPATSLPDGGCVCSSTASNIMPLPTP
ncbi:Histidine phosphatase superfamily, clade-1 [Metarhizium album ARSEF 1941]|uniref:Histidine phosphatase superfamily, clade-1 n=1 Tax=Metarhizium album (strain ARSEF 1941) TaxID=1081103 RepID=A0A0B2WMF2_METAS|nr:Histidine phosphatase superfamily, clade-1 [Metarhizium album ARSEF 1941]KHN94849.1 Histidine phosphatase superfamily, clade-1 [Metarhizium album ARSEF 1941]